MQLRQISRAPALALTRGAVKGATVSDTIPFQQVAAATQKETVTVMNRVFGEMGSRANHCPPRKANWLPACVRNWTLL